MYLVRKLFGEILPFRMDPRRRFVRLKGGLASEKSFSEADSVILRPTEDDRLEVSVAYANEIPTWLHSPDSGSAIWFHADSPLQLRILLPDGFHYDLNVRVLSAPDFFLNEAGRPEPHPPMQEQGKRYVVEIIENRWWVSDEHSHGREWHFSVNDLPELPPLRESRLCQLNTTPGIYPGAYFTCTINDTRYPVQPVEYWFSYELENALDRPNVGFNESSIISKHRYRFSFGRTDKQELDVNEGHRVIDLWEYVLGFCSGTFRTADIIIGYGDQGGWSYVEMPKRLAKQSPCRFSWFPQHWPLDFPSLACRFFTHFQKDYDRRSNDKGVPVHFFDSGLHNRHGFGASIPILDGYLRAATLELPHDALNAAFAALEAHIKQELTYEDKQPLRPGEIGQFLRDKGIPPGNRNRAIGSYENVAWGNPRVITGVKEPPQGKSSWVVEAEFEPTKPPNPDDEEYGINYIKAWRDKRAAHFDAHAGGGTFHDIQNYAQMTLEYLELLVFQMMDHGSLYRSRTSMFYDTVKMVPWASNDPDGQSTAAEIHNNA